MLSEKIDVSESETPFLNTIQTRYICPDFQPLQLPSETLERQTKKCLRELDGTCGDQPYQYAAYADGLTPSISSLQNSPASLHEARTYERLMNSSDLRRTARKSSNEERPKWTSGTEFFLTTLCYNFGIGNLWRFPVLCCQHGGFSFLVMDRFKDKFKVGNTERRRRTHLLRWSPTSSTPAKGFGVKKQICGANLLGFNRDLIN